MNSEEHGTDFDTKNKGSKIISMSFRINMTDAANCYFIGYLSFVTLADASSIRTNISAESQRVWCSSLCQRRFASWNYTWRIFAVRSKYSFRCISNGCYSSMDASDQSQWQGTYLPFFTVFGNDQNRLFSEFWSIKFGQKLCRNCSFRSHSAVYFYT